MFKDCGFWVLVWSAACDFIGHFFRHCQMQKQSKHQNQSDEAKNESLVCSVFCFLVCSIQLILPGPQSLFINNDFFGFSSISLCTPYIFWTLNCSKKIVKGKHEILYPL